MLSVNPEFELKKAIKNNTLIVFAGAGTSKNAALPDWKELVYKILDHLEQKLGVADYKKLQPLLEKGILTPLEVLNILERNKFIEPILEVIVEELQLKPEIDLELHKKIIQLTPKVITTNYDRCFETAWGTSAKVVHNNDPFSLWKLKDASQYIFKIHGDIEHPWDCILFEQQYEKLYAQEAFWIGFMNLLMNSTVLFIGFSLSDPFVNSVLIRIKEMYKGLTNKHFVITTDKKFEVHELSDIIIPIMISDYKKDLAKKLDDLVPVVSNLPVRPYKEFIRHNMVAEVMKQMKENLSTVVIKGESGIGKKSLAFEVGYASLQQTNIPLKDRVRFNNVILISSTELKHSSNCLNLIFDTIGVAFRSEKVTKIAEDRLWIKDWEVYKLLQENSTLIIIDSFESIQQPEELLKWVQKIPETCKVILTTTTDVSIAASKIVLEGLSKDEAFQLIKNELGTETELLQYYSEEDLSTLFEYTKGNPCALQLTTGEIKKRTLNMNEIKEAIREARKTSALEQLHNRAWNLLLSENAKNFLLLFSVFSSLKSVDKAALLKVCEYARLHFDSASQECDSLNLLMISDDDLHQQYLVPHQSRAFIQQKLNPHHKKQIRNYWITYFVEFIRETVKRKQPDEPYWNALVSNKMKNLKKYWNGINEVLSWVMEEESYDPLLIELTTLLVHYMDSRFYNQQRLILVNKAIEATRRLHRTFKEALFRIDALGWTYIEESSLEKATEEIKLGLELAQKLAYTDPVRSEDLFALGNAWLARAEIELNHSKAAFEAIEKALTYRGKPWIYYRVYMAAGDIFVHEKRFNEALENYELAKAKYDLYDGEGQDYQINPRIGLAYLRNNKIEEAIHILATQVNEDIPIGSLYAEYGLALINYKQGKKEEAIQKLDEIEREIYKRASSNVLLKLIKTFREEEMDEIEPLLHN